MIHPSPKASFSLESHGEKPLIVFFCATYLRPEMHHIHRQILALDYFSRLVVTQKVENWDSFPFEPLVRLKKSRWRWWARFQERSLKRGPWQISQKETRQLIRLLKNQQASILHIFFGTVAIHLLPILQLCPIPVVVSFHGADVAGIMISSPYRRALSELFERAALLTCRSLDLAEKLKSLGCPAGKICLQRTVLPDLPFYLHSPPRDGQWKILQASRLIPKKGLRTTLQAFALFVQKYSGSLTIAGEGPMKEELEELARQLNISSRVRFVGFQNQEALQHLLANHSIFLHPSESTADGDTEGIPNALLEALASGIPCIATRHGGIPEAMKNGVDGILVEERQPAELARAMILLAEDADLYHQLGRRGAGNVRNNFGRESVQLASSYRYLLSGAKEKLPTLGSYSQRE